MFQETAFISCFAEEIESETEIFLVQAGRIHARPALLEEALGLGEEIKGLGSVARAIKRTP